MEKEDNKSKNTNFPQTANPFLSASANIFQNAVAHHQTKEAQATPPLSNAPESSAPQSEIFTPMNVPIKNFSQTLHRSSLQKFTSMRRKRRSVDADIANSASKHYIPSMGEQDGNPGKPSEQEITSATSGGIKPMMDRPRFGIGIKKPIAKTKLHRLSTPSETSSAIVCLNLPTTLNKKELLHKHFSQFGNILKIQTNAIKQTAFICFSNNDEATNAKRKGTIISSDNSPVKILYVKSHTKTADRTPALISKLHSAPLSWVKEASSENPSSSIIPRSTAMGFDLFAKTDKEKLEMLEKVDTLLRKQIVKQSDITKAKIFKGTCQDMCPEKERYLRQDRNILALYETSKVTPGLVNHAHAIKEYSRSSADQEEPLPHDLRPSSAIHLSMMYLLIDIIPRMGDGDIAEWYDFIWNRTRAIRKEISIQQIKDPTAIKVIEQCARFHIFCAHHLIQYERMNFDPNINNENLEKTMKTLLDLYHDTKESEAANDSFFVPNSNQAEFYSYYILLNMNKTADVLHELQEMSSYIRQSEPVRLAVAAFTALHNDNFSRFFKVVKQSMYLQGAILHRYFTQVRKSALRIMSKGYCLKRQTAIPSTKIIDMLCFNDKEELYNFCDQFSIQYNENDVILISQGLEQVETAMAEFRSNVVTGKIVNFNLGELIANEKLPAWEDIDYKPTSSFDVEGRYIGKYGQLLKSGKGFMNNEESLERIMSPKKKLSIEQEKVVKTVTKTIFHEVINEICESVSAECMNTAYMLKLFRELCAEIIKEESDLLINAIAEEVIHEELRELKQKLQFQIQKEKEERERQIREQHEKERIEKLKKEEEIFKQRQCLYIVENLTAEIVDECVKDIVVGHYNNAKQNARSLLLDELSDVVFTELFQKASSKFILETAKSEWKLSKKEKCKESEEIFRLNQLRKHWMKWKLEKLKQVRLENARRTFPGAPYLQSNKNQLKHLVPHSTDNYDLPNCFFLTKAAKLTTSSPQIALKRKTETEMNLNKVSKQSKEFHKVAVSKIPFQDIIMKMHLKENFIENPLFTDNRTLLIKVLNVVDSVGNTSEFLKWYQKLFISSNGNFDCDVVNYDSSGNITEKEPRYSVAVCTKVLQSTDEILLQDIEGTSMLIYTITKSTSLEDATSLLQALLSVKCNTQHIPVVIVLVDYNTLADSEIVSQLKLDTISYKSSVSVVSLNSNFVEIKNFFKLFKAIEYALADIPPLPNIKKTTLRDMLETYIPINYVTPLYKHIAQRAELNRPTLLPDVQVDLFNKVIMSLCHAATSDDLTEVPWPGLEFDAVKLNIPKSDWNSKNSFNEKQNAVMKALVPDFPNVPQLVNPIKDVTDVLFQYADLVVPNSLTLKSTLMSKVHEQFENCDHQFPWCQFVEMILSEHLTNLLYYNPVGNTVIWFDPSEMTRISSSCLTEEFKDLKEESEFYCDLNESHIETTLPYSPSQTLNQTENDSITFQPKYKEALTCSKHSIHFPSDEDLLSNEITIMQENIKTEKQKSVEFENRLQKILADGELPLTILHTNTFLDNLGIKSPK